jgi:hypothetical protein
MRRFGWPGTEPHDIRNHPVRRWGAQLLAFVALFVVSIGSVQPAAGIAALALALGAPRGWVWRNDLLSAAAWSLAVIALAAAEVAWLAGGSAARQSFGAHGRAGAAAILVFVSVLVQIVGYFRRWGTSGNTFYTDRMVRKGDPAAIRSVKERAKREGYRVKDPDTD